MGNVLWVRGVSVGQEPRGKGRQTVVLGGLKATGQVRRKAGEGVGRKTWKWDSDCI